ncbi:hypothetical protein MBANPS3_011881 [Mucor bainieri]
MNISNYSLDFQKTYREGVKAVIDEFRKLESSLAAYNEEFKLDDLAFLVREQLPKPTEPPSFGVTVPRVLGERRKQNSFSLFTKLYKEGVIEPMKNENNEPMPVLDQYKLLTEEEKAGLINTYTPAVVAAINPQQKFREALQLIKVVVAINLRLWDEFQVACVFVYNTVQQNYTQSLHQNGVAYNCAWSSRFIENYLKERGATKNLQTLFHDFIRNGLPDGFQPNVPLERTGPSSKRQRSSKPLPPNKRRATELQKEIVKFVKEDLERKLQRTSPLPNTPWAQLFSSKGYKNMWYLHNWWLRCPNGECKLASTTQNNNELGKLLSDLKSGIIRLERVEQPQQTQQPSHHHQSSPPPSSPPHQPSPSPSPPPHQPSASPPPSSPPHQPSPSPSPPPHQPPSSPSPPSQQQPRQQQPRQQQPRQQQPLQQQPARRRTNRTIRLTEKVREELERKAEASRAVQSSRFLHKDLEGHTRQIIDNSGNGDCGPKALAQQLYSEGEVKHDVVRKLMCETLLDNEEYYKGCYDQERDLINFEITLRFLTTPGAWYRCPACMQVAADTFCRPVAFYPEEGSAMAARTFLPRLPYKNDDRKPELKEGMLPLILQNEKNTHWYTVDLKEPKKFVYPEIIKMNNSKKMEELGISEIPTTKWDYLSFHGYLLE